MRMGQRLLRATLNFAVINVFVLLPMALTFGLRAPKDYSIVFDSSAPSVVVGSLNEAKDKGPAFLPIKSLSLARCVAGTRVVRSFFADIEPVETFSLTFKGKGGDRFVLREIAVTRWDLFSKTLSGVDVANAYEPVGGGQVLPQQDGSAIVELPPTGQCLLARRSDVLAKWQPWRVARQHWILPRQIVILGLLLEVVILVVSLLATFFVRHEDGFPSRICTLTLALVFAAFISVVVPLQTYLSNRSDFAVSDGEVVLSLLLLFVVTTLVAFVGLRLSRIGSGGLFHFVLFAFLVYEYLQTGVLSIGEPALDGNFGYYGQRFLIVRDTIVCIAVFALVLGCSRWIRPYLTWCALGLAVLSGASLLDIRVDKHQATQVKGSSTCESVALGFNYSSERNVLVFILDSLTPEGFEACLAKSPTLSQAFSGFTFFRKNLAMSCGTDVATGCLLTGEYFREPNNKPRVRQFTESVFERGVLPRFVNQNWRVGFLSTAFSFGYANPQNGMPDDSERREADVPLLRHTPHGVGFSLFEIVRFRLSPFAIKHGLYRFTRKCQETRAWTAEEEGLFPVIAAAPVTDAVPCFGYFHTNGPHVPYCISSEGVRTSEFRSGFEAYVDHANYCLKHLAELFEALKRKGVYDQATIIVTADHGPHDEQATARDHTPDDMSLHAYAMLMVKPPQASGPFQIDEETPTSHAGVCDLLNRLCVKDLALQEMVDCLSNRGNRTFVYPQPGYYEEWAIDQHMRATRLK